jgi:hypothetical protein
MNPAFALSFPYLFENATHPPKQREDACQSFSAEKRGTREANSRVPASTDFQLATARVTAAEALGAASVLE